MSFRPEIIVNQEFIDNTPVVNVTELTPGLIGINRLQVYRSSAGDFVSGIGSTIYDFPEFIAGSAIETTTAILDVPNYTTALQPKIYISSNAYGVAQLSDSFITYDYANATFTLDPALTVDFVTATGTTGSYLKSGTVNQFTDTSADFIESNVKVNDSIYIKNTAGEYIEELKVVAPGIIDGFNLEVEKVNKSAVPNVNDVTLSISDAYLHRTVTAPSETFVTKNVQAGDYLYMTGWSIVKSDLGGSYTAETLGVRTFTDATGVFATTATVTDVIYQDIGDSDELVPAFYINAAGIVSDTSLLVTNADPTSPATALTETGRAYDIRYYAAAKTLNGGASTELVDGAYGIVGDTASFPGTGLSLTGQERIFRSATANWAAAATPPLVGDVIVIDENAVGNATPGPGVFAEFVITQIDSVTNTDLAVTAINTTTIGASATGSSERYSIYLEQVRASSARHAASYGQVAAGGAPAGERLFTNSDVTVNYSTLGVAIGDIIKDSTGASVFEVTSVTGPASAWMLWVSDVTGSSLVPTDEATYFEHAITDDNLESQLEVVSVTSETVLIAKTIVLNTPLETVAVLNAAISKINYKDVGTNLDYKVGHLTSGAGDADGAVLVTYTARRADYTSQLLAVTEDTYQDALGEPTPANPLSLGLSKVFEVYKGIVYAIQVTDDNLDSWKVGLRNAASPLIYQPVVCTQNELVIQEVIAHVSQYSAAVEKRERIGWISHKEVIQSERTNAVEFPGGTNTITKDLVSGATSIILDSVDATLYGATVGDVISGTWTGTGTGTFSDMRIVTIVGATPSAGKTTLTIVPQNGITDASSLLTAWDITARPLSLLERAQQQAAYTTGIGERRIRNIWPDSVEDTFTDSLGVFGTPGSDLDVTLGAWLLSCTEAGKRALYTPATPLTAQKLGAYKRILDPMIDEVDYQDIIIDGGNYYMTQDQEAGAVYAIRALTTNVTEFEYAEESVTPQIDYFAILLRNNLLPLMGSSKLNQNFYDAIMMAADAVANTVLLEENLKEINFISLEEDPDRPDGFIMKWQVVPFFSGAHGEIYIYI